MGANLSIDEKYNILQDSNPLEGAGTDLLKKILVGAGVGGAGSYLLADTNTNEDPKTRRKRILRNTLLGATLGGGLVGGLAIGDNIRKHAIPTLTDVAKESEPGFLANNSGKVLLGLLGAGTGAVHDHRKTVKNIERIRDAVGNSAIMEKGTSLKDLIATIKKRSVGGKAVREVIRNPGGGRHLAKAITRLGLNPGGSKILKVLGRHKGLAALGALGAATPWVAGKGWGALTGAEELD